MSYGVLALVLTSSSILPWRAIASAHLAVLEWFARQILAVELAQIEGAQDHMLVIAALVANNVTALSSQHTASPSIRQERIRSPVGGDQQLVERCEIDCLSQRRHDSVECGISPRA